MIFSIIGIAILIYSFNHFKKGFLIYMIFEIFWFPSAKIINLSGVPSVPISLVMAFSFACLYYIKTRKQKRKHEPFPFTISFILLAFSRFATCFTALAGIGDEFPRMIGYCFSSLIEVFLIWRVIETEKDFKFIFNCLIVSFLIAGAYGCIESLIQSNFISEYKSSLMNEEMFIYGDSRGYRIMSVFEHPLGAGMNFGLYVIIILTAMSVYHVKFRFDKTVVLVSVALCLLCVLFTKMRSGLFFLVVGSLSFLSLKNKNTYLIIAGFFIFALLAIPLLGDNVNIFLSLFNKSAQAEVGGSSSEMRFNQMFAVLQVMRQSPLTGLGDQCLEHLNSLYSSDLLALESVYFEELVKHGMLGMGATAVLMLYSMVVIPKKYKSREFFMLAFAFWATYSLTSVPFFRINIYYIALFYYIKKTPVYRRNRMKDKFKSNRTIITSKTCC